MGVALVMLKESGLEVLMSITRPAAIGEDLIVRLAAADVVAGTYRMEEVYAPAAAIVEEDVEGEGVVEGSVTAGQAAEQGGEDVALLLDQGEVLVELQTGEWKE